MPKSKLTTSNGASLPSASIGGMKWTWAIYGPVDINQSKKTLFSALEKGFISIDTADCYLGSDGHPHNEIFIGGNLRQAQSLFALSRNDVFISSKCGIKLDPNKPWTREVDISEEYIKQACKASLERLNTPFIDLFYLHRITEETTTIEQSMQAMYELHQTQKVRYIGVSEANPDLIQRADDELRRLSLGVIGLSAVQSEYNLLRRGPEINGVFNLCRERDIAFFAYSPLCRGLASDIPLTIKKGDCRLSLEVFQSENLLHNRAVIENLKRLADAYNCSLAQFSIAWICAQSIKLGIQIYPIFGTANPKHLLENINALAISLSSTTLSDVDNIAPIGITHGKRYPEQDMNEFKLLE